MSFTQQINDALKEAMKAKDEASLRALRAIKSAILLAKTEKGGADEITEEQELKLLQKLAKQRKESLDIYRAQGREDLAKVEEEELSVIEKFLPAQLSADDIYNMVKKVASENGLSAPQDMGKLMPLAIKALGGMADGKTISEMVKKVLSGE